MPPHSLLAPGTLLLLLGALGVLQPARANAQADSLAAVARARYREAMAAEKRGDGIAARDLLVAAHRAWPLQPVYLLSAAVASARLADTVATVTLLGRLADLGAGVDIDVMPAFAALRSAPAFGPIRRRLNDNRAPLIRSKVVATIGDTSVYPEGLGHDPRTGSWFVASIRQRKIIRIDRDGHTGPFGRLPDGRRLDAVLGVRVDTLRRILWATTRALPQMEGYLQSDGSRATVFAFALDNGRLLGVGVPTDSARHHFGDLVIDPQGVAYLTDSESPVLYRAALTPSGIVLEEVLRHRLFRSLQGLVFDDTGQRLYLADYSHGLLLVNLAEKTVVPVGAPPGLSTLGLDGLARSGSAIIGVQNGIAPPRIVRFDLNPAGTEIVASKVLDRHLPVADEPTIGTVVGNRFIYVANSQWEKYGDDGRRRPGTVLRPTVLLSAPIDVP